MNVIARLEYGLAYNDSIVHRFNHYATRTPPQNVVRLSLYRSYKLVSACYSSSSSRVDRMEFSDSHSRHPSLGSFYPGRSSRLHTVSAQSWYMQILTTCQLLCVYVQKSIKEHLYLYVPNSAQHVLIVLLGWLVRWEVSGRITSYSRY